MANPVRPGSDRGLALVVDNASADRRDVLAFYVEGWAPPAAPRWEWRFGVGPAEAIALLLRRLQRRADHVEIRELALGDLAVLSAGPGEPKRPVAFLAAGLTLGEALTALATLKPKILEHAA